MCHGTWQPWRHQKSAGGAGASCAQALKTGQLKQGTRWHLFSDTDDVVLIPDLEDGPCHLLCQSKRVTSINPLRPTWNRHSACKGTTATPPAHEVQSVFQSKSQSYQVSQCLATRLEVLLRCPEGVRASFQVTDSTAAGTTSSASHGKRTSPQEVVDGDGDLRREIMRRVIVSPHELQQASQQQSVSSSFASPGLALTEVQLSWLCDHPTTDPALQDAISTLVASRATTGSYEVSDSAVTL